MRKGILLLLFIFCLNCYSQINYSAIPQDSARYYLYDALVHYGVKYPAIVYSQAILETGWCKSNLYKATNNLFGLYNSRKNEFFRFTHWTESIKGYLKYIQKRYHPPQDYYEFLDKIGYAEDPMYIDKLKRICKNYENNNRR